MVSREWSEVFARQRRQRRHLAIARALLRLFRLTEVEPIPIGEFSLVSGYVTYAIDMQPVVKVARNVVDGTQSVDDLRVALARFDGSVRDPFC